MINTQNHIIRVSFWASWFLFLLQALWFAIYINRLPPEVPLFYSRPWGEKQLTTAHSLLILPASSAIILITNIFLTRLIKPKESLACYLLYIFAAVYCLLSLITLVKICLIVT